VATPTASCTSEEPAISNALDGDVPFAVRSARPSAGLAEQIAAKLRLRILSGEFVDGERLPTQERLLAEFGSGRSSLREGLRILEAEGLIAVRRGKAGGATVHLPRVDTAAYALQLVLSSNRVPHDDVAQALRQLEPVCAALCALRPDRERTVLPALEEVHAEASRTLDDLGSVGWATGFHDAVVRSCGNDTLVLIIGALHKVWSEDTVALRPDGFEPAAARRLRLAAMDDHDLIIRMIRRGDADAAARIMRQHRGRRNAVLAPAAGTTEPPHHL
jgi:DNA-binding FadR family transcriptional regulator